MRVRLLLYLNRQAACNFKGTTKSSLWYMCSNFILVSPRSGVGSYVALSTYCISLQGIAKPSLWFELHFTIPPCSGVRSYVSLSTQGTSLQGSKKTPPQTYHWSLHMCKSKHLIIRAIASYQNLAPLEIFADIYFGKLPHMAIYKSGCLQKSRCWNKWWGRHLFHRLDFSKIPRGRVKVSRAGLC